MMIYLQLLWAFLQVGMFSFGGAYGAIPLIRDIVLSYGWLSEERFAYFIAVSESTPGPIMVNMATYVGSSQAGFWGALLATVGVVLPSFIIILVIVSLMQNLIANVHVQAVLRGIRPSFIGIVLATGIYMIYTNLFPRGNVMQPDMQAAFITCTLVLLSYGYHKIRKQDFPPIALIVVSALMGMVVYAW